LSSYEESAVTDKLIRKAFIPSSSEHILIDADYSQIELRVLADISEDEHLINAFKNKEDIHRMTAAKIFDVSEDKVTKNMRSSAKAVNFGIVYGISDFGLSKDLNISKKEAQKYIDSYFEKYPKIKDYMDNIIKFAKENEYVSTKWNRRRYIPEINSRNFMVRSGANRIAMNTPIQGTAADIIKIAMISVYKRLKLEGLKSRLILQVHDELIIDALKDEKEKVLVILKEEMENAATLKVPLVADINEGESWYDSK
jgi:DNA polymerase-1